jgi:hypothetical protein
VPAGVCAHELEIRVIAIRALQSRELKHQVAADECMKVPPSLFITF